MPVNNTEFDNCSAVSTVIVIDEPLNESYVCILRPAVAAMIDSMLYVVVISVGVVGAAAVNRRARLMIRVICCK